MTALNTVEDAARLLALAGERLKEHLRFAAIEPHRWYVLFRDGGAYELEWSDDWGWLVLTAELGHPSPEGERIALNLALSYNALWRQLGKLRMARDGEDGELLLMGEVGAGDADVEGFCAALLHFEGLRRHWMKTFERVGLEPAAPPILPSQWLERI